MASTSSSGGMGFGSVLTVVFVVLKLTKVISWSWLWVLSPTWIILAFVAILYIGLKLAEKFGKV